MLDRCRQLRKQVNDDVKDGNDFDDDKDDNHSVDDDDDNDDDDDAVRQIS